jgi:hypothetical protein
MRLLSFVLFTLASLPAAAATTIDFEEFDSNGSENISNSVISQGYVITHSLAPAYDPGFPWAIGSPGFGVPGPSSNGGNVLNYCADTFCFPDAGTEPVFTLQHESNTIFDLNAVEFAGSYSGIVFEVTGYLNSGGTISTSVVSDGLAWQTIGFGSEWANLSKVEFRSPVTDSFGYSAGIDGIVVTTVPIPAAVWLFGSGLGLLGWFRRRQTA